MTGIQTATTPATNLPEGWYDSLRSVTRPGEPDWLQSMRSAAAAEILTNGLPGNKDEAWKYTSVRRLEGLRPQRLVPEPSAPPRVSDSTALPGLAAGEHVFGFQFHAGELSWLPGTVPAGVTVSSLKELLDQPGGAGRDELQRMLESVDYTGRGRAFEALNAALWSEGVVVHVAAGVDAGHCLAAWHSLNGPDGCLDSFRLIVRLEEGARLALLDQHGAAHGPAIQVGAGESHATRQGLNLLMVAELAPHSNLQHVRVQQDGADQALLTFTEVRQADGSLYSYFGFDLGGGLVRHDMRCRLEGIGARAELQGAFVLDGERLVDHHLCVDHLAPGCTSEQFFRGVLADRSRGVFNGKTLIRPGADGSKVRQSSANLLLSDLAEVDTKPELEIYADEVEASHGATVGQLDEQAVFYLRTRGLPQAEAHRMLISAFCRTVSSRLPNFSPGDLSLAEHIGRLLDESMAGASLAGLAGGKEPVDVP